MIIIVFSIQVGSNIFLGTDLPIVAVVSDSMTHDDTTQVRHYQFLQDRYGYTTEQINSWSLKNGFLKGDVLVVKGVEKEDLKVGDVIVYNIPGQSIPIVHRIVEINENILTKGDHNSVADSWKPSTIHGKAVFVIPFLGWPKLIVTQIWSVVF